MYLNFIPFDADIVWCIGFKLVFKFNCKALPVNIKCPYFVNIKNVQDGYVFLKLIFSV